VGKFVLALDQGTTSSRAILFTRDGHVYGTAQREIPQFHPRPGWVEHDPEAIWDSQIGVARQVLADCGVHADEIDSIGIANQRETTLVWDRETGRAIHPAIVWQDRRTADHCEQLKSDGFEGTLSARTGLLADAYFSATKLAWLLDNVPGVREKSRDGQLAFGTVDSFLLWRLTGGTVHATDLSNASRTMLLDIQSCGWSSDLLTLFGIPREMLPKLVPSSGVAGVTHPKWFGREIPIAGIAGDQQAALFGQACFRPGMAKSTYGTGCFLLLHIGGEAKPSTHRLLTTVAATHRGVDYALEGSVFVAGAAVQWLRDDLRFIEKSSDVEALATSVEDSGGVYVVPSFVGLGAPYWDPHAQGAILGLTRGRGPAHIARATLESIAFQCRDVLDAMKLDGGGSLTEIRVDGGAASNDFLMQFQADILDLPVVRPMVTETTALGAAYLAGLATGFWSSMEEIESLWAKDRVFEPSMSASHRESLYSGWKEAVGRVRR